MISPTGTTHLAAVIGDPVRHSLSPAIHNAAFAACDLDWVYVALPVSAGNGGAAVRAMATLGIGGLSVTMPHKADVAAAVDRRTPAVDKLGFCNCVFRDGDTLVGDSTDGDGLVRSLQHDEGISVDGAATMVIGTGGAASAIIEAFGRHGAADIVVTSRSPQRAAEAARLAGNARAGSAVDASQMDLIVNASPVGMAGGPAPGDLPLDADILTDRHAVIDIVYQPRVTPLLAAAGERGAVAVNGVGMLVHQAALAFERWTGEPAPIDAMLSAAFPDR
ncbi:MAG: shikimate dehydrogenase [Acidimicrobiales bacterium]